MAAAGGALTYLAHRRGEEQPKLAFVGELAGLAGRTAVKGIGGAGKMLINTLKTPEGRNAVGTTALVGGMGASGFMRGAQADRIEAPEFLSEAGRGPHE